MDINDFLTTYKELEQILRNKDNLIGDGSVLSYENTLNQDDLEKLKLCRIIRNYCQHHADYKKFVAISDEMIRFLEKQIASIEKQESTAKDLMRKLKVPTTKDTLNDVLKFMSKNKLDWCPVLNDKPTKKVPVVAGVITAMTLLDLLVNNKPTTKLKSLVEGKAIQKELKNYPVIDTKISGKKLTSDNYIVVEDNSYKGIIF